MAVVWLEYLWCTIKVPEYNVAQKWGWTKKSVSEEYRRNPWPRWRNSPITHNGDGMREDFPYPPYTWSINAMKYLTRNMTGGKLHSFCGVRKIHKSIQWKPWHLFLLIFSARGRRNWHNYLFIGVQCPFLRSILMFSPSSWRFREVIPRRETSKNTLITILQIVNRQ